MDILDLRPIPKCELFDRLRDVQLRGHDQAKVYKNASLKIRDFSTNELWPAQRYVIRRRVEEITALRDAILEHTKDKVDIFALSGGLYVTINTKKTLSPVDNDGIVVAEGTPIEVEQPMTFPILPPIVEHSTEWVKDDTNKITPHITTPQLINLINDGMHRCFAARWSGYRINCVYVVGAALPYYAFPLERKWMGVSMVDEAPPSGDERKNYREPDDHKALFRDFNALFPGVQTKR